jgi:3-hexulose-6-phosphate synthase
MKLHIAFDLTDLDHALSIAQAINHYADIFEVGSLLIYKNGMQAVSRFKQQFPNKTILADVKIADRAKETAILCSDAGADWITVLSGTRHNVIHSGCNAAHERGKKVMLDLIDASSLGQSALEAKSFGVDALLLTIPSQDSSQLTFLETWDMVKGNTPLPIHISGNISLETLPTLIDLNPAAIVIGKEITSAAKPAAEAEKFYKLIHS